MTAIVIVTLFTVLLAAKATGGKMPSVREYAHRLVLKKWHSESEWRAFAEIIRRESGWSPCAVYPGSRDCSYSGSNSCGLGQRNPCPGWMRGRLWETRYRQVVDVIAYVDGRYGSPSAALAYWNRNRSY